MHLIGKATPPRQILHGSPLVLETACMTDEASVIIPAYILERRVLHVVQGGLVTKSRLTVFRYAVRTNGDIFRSDEDGNVREIGPGDKEFEWVRAALRYRHERTFMPPVMWSAPRPEDLISIQEVSHGK